MTYGRPLMIPPAVTRNAAVFTLTTHDNFHSTSPIMSASQAEGTPSLMACYSYALKLQEILGEMLTAFYQDDQLPNAIGDDNRSFQYVGTSSLVSRLKAGDFQDLLRLDKSLSSWQETLPQYLKVIQCESHNGLGNDENAFPEALTENNGYIVPSRVMYARQANVLKAR